MTLSSYNLRSHYLFQLTSKHRSVSYHQILSLELKLTTLKKNSAHDKKNSAQTTIRIKKNVANDKQDRTGTKLQQK
jgi:hypothetical protein